MLRVDFLGLLGILCEIWVPLRGLHAHHRAGKLLHIVHHRLALTLAKQRNVHTGFYVLLPSTKYKVPYHEDRSTSASDRDDQHQHQHVIHQNGKFQSTPNEMRFSLVQNKEASKKPPSSFYLSFCFPGEEEPKGKGKKNRRKEKKKTHRAVLILRPDVYHDSFPFLHELECFFDWDALETELRELDVNGRPDGVCLSHFRCDFCHASFFPLRKGFSSLIVPDPLQGPRVPPETRIVVPHRNVSGCGWGRVVFVLACPRNPRT